jgi:hypothetical protein
MLAEPDPGDAHGMVERSDERQPSLFQTGAGEQVAVGRGSSEQGAVSVSADTPPAPRPDPPRPSVQSWLDLIANAIEEWGRTIRLVVLAVTAALCLASILYVVQLSPDRWRAVLAAASPVVAWVGAKQIRGGGASGSGSSDQR